ncbi:SRPBCC family protein [Marimonas arenosa]|uniref:SRPBCC family protein n=1 Tax=Marimonas arenosa TaxID=1795305 RepID=A0AAE3WF85_9RHOB|nr:SRPBCC family protein [Marimonas arenosa]MDQ2090595.1 SRPBCC family protein [Marimonas arenosa]
MTTILRTIDIDMPSDAVWAKVADTSQISELIGFVAESSQDGATRVCALEGGGELRETIVSVDDDLRRVMYSITESPLNMEFHAASMQVVDNGGKARLIWTVDLLPDAAAEHMAPMIDSACADMKTALAG